MRGPYTVSHKISSLAAAKTLLYLTAPAGKLVKILSASVTNASNETNEQLEAGFQRITTLGTPTATAKTPAPNDPGDPAAGSTVKADVTASEPTYTADTEFGREGFSSLAGWFFKADDQEPLIVAAGASIGLRMLSTPAAFDAVLKLVFVETG